MTQQHPDIDSLTERVDRMLDGMAVNRELLARDVKRMATELAQWRNAHALSQPKEPSANSGGPFSSAFDDLFSGFRP